MGIWTASCKVLVSLSTESNEQLSRSGWLMFVPLLQIPDLVTLLSPSPDGSHEWSDSLGVPMSPSLEVSKRSPLSCPLGGPHSPPTETEDAWPP